MHARARKNGAGQGPVYPSAAPRTVTGLGRLSQPSQATFNLAVGAGQGTPPVEVSWLHPFSKRDKQQMLVGRSTVVALLCWFGVNLSLTLSFEKKKKLES